MSSLSNYNQLLAMMLPYMDSELPMLGEPFSYNIDERQLELWKQELKVAEAEGDTERIAKAKEEIQAYEQFIRDAKDPV